MIKKLLLFPVLIISLLIFINYYANPPDGYTGAPIPDEFSCAVCHNYDTKHFEASTEIVGIPTKISPGETYPVEIIVSNADKKAKRTSFQMVAVNADKNNAGIFLNPKGNVKFSTYKNRTYSESQPGVKLSNGKSIFKFDWKAPVTSTNSIISFYATAVIADGDNTFANDAVKQTATFGILGNSLNVETIEQTNNYCRGDSSGYAKIKISGGTSPYKIQWTDGSGTNELSNLKAGLYFVTATDANGLKGIGKIKITEPDLLLIDSAKITNPSTTGLGTLSVAVSGGTPPYVFRWEYNNAFFSGDSAIYNLYPGNYKLELKDNCNTIIDTVFTLKYSSSVDYYLSENLYVFPNPVDNILKINSPGFKIQTFKFYGLSGKKFDERNVNSNDFEIDVSQYKSGIYFIVLTNAKHKLIRKIVIR